MLVNHKKRARPAVRACNLCRKLKIRCAASPKGCCGCRLRDCQCTYKSKPLPSTSLVASNLVQALHLRQMGADDITNEEAARIVGYFANIHPQLASTACLLPADFESIIRDGTRLKFTLANYLILAILGLYLDKNCPSPSNETIHHCSQATGLIPYLLLTSPKAPLIHTSLQNIFYCASFFTNKD